MGTETSSRLVTTSLHRRTFPSQARTQIVRSIVDCRTAGFSAPGVRRESGTTRREPEDVVFVSGVVVVVCGGAVVVAGGVIAVVAALVVVVAVLDVVVVVV